jgi:hypothetical protein
VNIAPGLFANIKQAEKLATAPVTEKKSFIRKRLVVKVTFVFLIRLQQFSKETVGIY